MKHLLTCFLLAAAFSPAAAAQSAPPPIDPHVDARAEALLHRMTLDEKLGQLSQIFWYKGAPDDRIREAQDFMQKNFRREVPIACSFRKCQ